MWQYLFNEIAVLAILIVCISIFWGFLNPETSRRGQVGYGILMGAAAQVSKLGTVVVVGGYTLDLVAALFGCAAFYGGAFALAAAAAIILLSEFFYSGSSLLVALPPVLSIGALSLALRKLLSDKPPTYADCVLLAAATTAGYLIAFIVVPILDFRDVEQAAALPPATLFIFLGTLLAGSLLHREWLRRKLERTNLIYRRMVESLPDPIYAKTLDGRFLAANAATAAMMGVHARDLIGRSEAEIRPSCEAEASAAQERSVLGADKIAYFRREIHVENAPSRAISSAKVPMRDDRDRLIGLICHDRDITREEEMLRAKGEFVSTVSHELRTPLTSLRGSITLLSNQIGSEIPSGILQLIDIAKRNSERLGHLINDILDAEKIQTGSMRFVLEPVNVADIVDTIVEDASDYLPEQRVTIVKRILAPDAVAQLDLHRAEQILNNLLSNAIKFSAVGGTVTVELRRENGEVILEVADQGLGIPEDYQPRIFEQFLQVDSSDTRRKDGTGLGLHITKVLVDGMEGRISLDSTLGQGTTFRVAFPDRTPASRDGTPPGPEKARPRVLYAEDDGSLGQLIAHSLGPEIECVQVRSAAALRHALDTEKFDLLLLDFEFPDGVAEDVMAARELPTLLFTGKDVDTAYAEQLDGHFLKSVSCEIELIDEIRARLGLNAPPTRLAG
ncbi:PAS domain-containing protein [Maribius pontilimi]|uniref:histidine kinase n=1 Tax=Palleronia pontilimi TaxID=1964209 RepID=A0A934M948_9RHOB|nr:ATP-binding protein [Palleronia pontilimi]MBJ3762137.1 PAS domain-containing protein [Palleronia pontilimi]